MKQTKTAAIYDRWLHTLGGGEQVAFGYAEVLRDLGYSVELLTHAQVDLKHAQKKMNVDLKDITVRYIPNLPDSKLGSYTTKYDLFVNTSYMDHIPNQAKKSILSIFFPAKLSLPWHEYLKRAVVIPFLRTLFIYPTMFEGFSNDTIIDGKYRKPLAEKAQISFNKPLKQLTVKLYFKQFAFSVIDGTHFSIIDQNKKRTELTPVKKTELRNNIVSYSFDFGQLNTTLLEPTSKLVISLPESPYSASTSLDSILIPKIRYSLYQWFKQLFPTWEIRLHGGPSIVNKQDLTSYSKIITISDFSKSWITKYWNLDSQILYPPVAVESFAPAKQKKNMILHIGRFFVGGHSKKQLQMVQVFKKLVDAGHTNWQLDLVGGVAQGKAHAQYLQKIKDEAAGYPIYFHTDAPFTKLQQLLSEAKLYWHATGLDENDNKHPVLLEHFGITTVEAMAAGCVPIVIDKGAQPEIVTNEAGFLWQTREQLYNLTDTLMKDDSLRKKMSQNAQQRSKHFSKKMFTQQLSTILEKL